MSLFSFKYLTKTNYLNLLFVAIPISFIAGNTAINVNIVLLILSTFFLYGSNLVKIRYYLLDKIIVLFFVCVWSEYVCCIGPSPFSACLQLFFGV